MNQITSSSDTAGYTQQIGSKLYHCDAHGLVQVVRDAWKARNMGSDEVVRFFAADYQAARRAAMERWPGCVVAVWRDEA